MGRGKIMKEYRKNIGTNSKWGPQELIIDEEDKWILDEYSWCLWTTDNYHTFYVVSRYSMKEKRLIKGKRLHRLIMNPPDNMVIDHINGNGLDNRKSNLRITTQAKNNRNARKRKNAITSEYKGVHYDKRSNKWIAQIQINKKKIHLGYHLTELEAAEAYNQGCIKFHGNYGILNEL